MIIYGAGMSGLLAARMLRRFDPVIHEAAPELPNNHAALLRFRSDIVSRETGIPFKKVWVQKAVLDIDGNLTNNPSIMLQNLYSIKVSGTIANRSIGNLAPGERWIAPEDFISQLAKGLSIEYNKPLAAVNDASKREAIISTIPMNMLMKIAKWSDVPEFKYNEITTITADITGMPCDVYQTVYIPQLNVSAYRASITGNKLIVECNNLEDFELENIEEMCRRYCDIFFGSRVGVSNASFKKQKYGKLVNSTGKIGKEFILAMTDIYGIYSLGRFATWRQILMDDVANDVRVIEQMIEQRDNYTRRLRA